MCLVKACRLGITICRWKIKECRLNPKLSKVCIELPFPGAPITYPSICLILQGIHSFITHITSHFIYRNEVLAVSMYHRICIKKGKASAITEHQWKVWFFSYISLYLYLHKSLIPFLALLAKEIVLNFFPMCLVDQTCVSFLCVIPCLIYYWICEYIFPVC